MRLDPAEVVDLPLAAALLDREGRQLAATPEWLGAGPGSIVYLLGQAHLLVAPEVPTPEELTPEGELRKTLTAKLPPKRFKTISVSLPSAREGMFEAATTRGARL